MGKAAPAELLQGVIPAGDYHIYAIGTQECERTIAQAAVLTSKKAWETKLWSHLGSEFQLLRSHTLQATHLAVYVHKGLLPMVSNIGSAAVATGYRDTLGNKGGVGVSFNLGRTSMLFMASHLEAHQTRVHQRNEHYHRIDTQMALPPGFRPRRLVRKGSSSQNSDATSQSRPPDRDPQSDDEGDETDDEAAQERQRLDNQKPIANGYDVVPSTDPKRRVACRFERVFWMGDFNYRIDGPRPDVQECIDRNTAVGHRTLLGQDQLRAEMRRGAVFDGFKEGPLNFKPTYKFDKDCNQYDTSKKQRVPAWTDRVLYKTTDDSAVELLHYNSVMSVTLSDHRPVQASFRVGISGFDDPTLVGAEEHEVGLATSQVCRVM